MTDREMLELAAKAAGIQVVGLVNDMIAQPDHRKDGFIVRNDRGGDSCWNPLTDDGDALRLAVRLRLPFVFGEDCVYSIGVDDCDEPYRDDPLAATRRAIVRAAAAIGKALP